VGFPQAEIQLYIEAVAPRSAMGQRSLIAEAFSPDRAATTVTVAPGRR
jgi:hypothetical protein